MFQYHFKSQWSFWRWKAVNEIGYVAAKRWIRERIIQWLLFCRCIFVNSLQLEIFIFRNIKLSRSRWNKVQWLIRRKRSSSYGTFLSLISFLSVISVSLRITVCCIKFGVLLVWFLLLNFELFYSFEEKRLQWFGFDFFSLSILQTESWSFLESAQNGWQPFFCWRKYSFMFD